MVTESFLDQDFISREKTFLLHPTTALLSVACSDRNFRSAVAEFEGRFDDIGVDKIVQPGGPLVLLEELAQEHAPTLARVNFLIQYHGIRALALIGHAACGAYQAKYAGKGLTPAQLDAQVQADLRLLQVRLPAVVGIGNIHSFFASPIDGGRVQFARL